jgi:KDO2-lipid IV(A) lauroyltransferase
MGLNLFQIIENHFCSREDIAKQVTYENKEVVDKALAEGRPIIFSSGHFGRWELAAVTISSQLAPSLIIYKTIKNRYFENYLIEARQRLGMTCVNSGGAVKAMVKQMRSKGAIAIMTDVNTSPRDGVKVDFFGHPTLHPRTPAYLASKFGAVIIPTFFYTDDDERFVMRFEEPIEAPKSGDEEADIIAMTQLQASQVEAAIRKRPELWFWPHRRWKSDYPEIYKS